MRDVEKGDPLVLVECKAVGKGPDVGLGQARSYAYWLKPAYYVVTDGDYLTVLNYQGGAVSDLRVCEARRAALRENFDDLYAVQPSGCPGYTTAEDRPVDRTTVKGLIAAGRWRY